MSSEGFAYGRTGDFERAIQDFNRALSLEPANVRALSFRRSAYE
jgi:Flp pilus assembly protein TadD